MIPVWNNEVQEKEMQNFREAIAGRNIMEGIVLEEFERQIKELLKVDYVVGVSSGSAALALAFMGIGIKPGDEIIVPDLTFIATANAGKLLGATVVVAPVQEDNLLLDLDKIDAYITYKTKAIVTVDLNGRIACGKKLREKYGSRGIYIIDDACQAFMSCGKDGMPAGSHVDIACYSFGITKMVTTIMGGLVATNNREIYEKIKIMKTQGMPSVFEGNEYAYPGFNFKLPDVLAAIGLGQLERLDEKMKRMREIDQMYREELSQLNCISFLDREKGELPWMTDILCEEKDKLRNILLRNEISSRPLGSPIHNAYYLQHKGNYTCSNKMREKMLYVPSGPDQDIKNVEKVISVIKSNALDL